MLNINEDDCKNINAVGGEPEIGPTKDEKDIEKANCGKNLMKSKYFNWLYALIISFLPLIFVPFYHLYFGGKFTDFLFQIFSSYEIIFIGISLIVASLNDFISENVNSAWLKANIFLIILGAAAYGIIAVAQEYAQGNDKISLNNCLLLIVNLSYLFLILLLGSSKYIKYIKEN